MSDGRLPNGNWTGRDPRLRTLRSLAGLVILGLVVYVVVDPAARDVGTLGALIGALLVDLGFEAGIRWPSASAPSRSLPEQTQPPIPPATGPGSEWDAP